MGVLSARDTGSGRDVACGGVAIAGGIVSALGTDLVDAHAEAFTVLVGVASGRPRPAIREQARLPTRMGTPAEGDGEWKQQELSNRTLSEQERQTHRRGRAT